MSTIAELRASLTKTDITPNIYLDSDWIDSNIKIAISKIHNNIINNPNEKHYYDIFVGRTNGFIYPEYYHKYVDEFKLRIEKIDNSLTAEANDFSNIGDPYFIGKNSERVAYYVRIKEI